MSFLDDLVTELVSSGCGSSGVEIFCSTKPAIPKIASSGVTSGATVQLIETGGTAPENTQNCTIRPAFIRPSAQIVVRSDKKVVSEAIAWRAYGVLFGIRNKTINGNWYRTVRPLQQPIDLGLDDQGQIKYGFNVIAAYNRRD